MASLSGVEKKFIYNFLKDNRVNIEIKAENKKTIARILDFNNKEIKIEFEDVFDEFKTKNYPIQCFFYFQNNYHVFSTTINKMQGKSAIIQNPDSIARNLQRQYERVEINGEITATIELPGKILPLDYPTTEKEYLPEEPPVNADFSDVKIKTILDRFKNKLTPLVTANKIVMLRNYTPASMLEEMVIESGKVLYVKNTKSDISIPNANEWPCEFLHKEDWIEFEKKKNNTSDTMMNKTISNYLINLKKAGITSEAIVPVIYRNYVVALIYLINTIKKEKPIDLQMVNYAFQFSKILTYTLIVNGYFKDEEGEKEKHEVPIHDISPGGMAIFMEDSELDHKLKLKDNYHVKFTVEGREIEVVGKLVRKFSKMSKNFYGFMFIDIKTEDYEYLNEVFGKKTEE